MTLKEIEEDAGYIFGSLLFWLDSVRHPASNRNLMRKAGMTDHGRIRLSLRIWLVATAVGFVLQIPLYKLAGVDSTALTFCLPSLAALLSIFFVTGGMIHAGLRIYGVPSRFPDTLGLYSITVGAYSPLFTLVTLPTLADIMRLLKTAKVAGMSDLASVAQRSVSDLIQEQASSGAGAHLVAVLSVALMIASMVLMVVLQRHISAH